jgi:hypothetical protein
MKPALVGLIGAITALASASPAAAGGGTPVDLQLVLALDISSSMTLTERRIQRDGYIAALRDPEVIAAVTSGPTGRIAITYVEWANYQIQPLQWTMIDGPKSAEVFAKRIAYLPFHREISTSISGALSFSADLFAESGAISERQAIDISGDGPNNAGQPVTVARDAVLARGITINGLPIMLHGGSGDDVVSLDQYYRDCVIGGPGAFTMPVTRLDEFALTIRLKLVQEIRLAARPSLPLLPIATGAHNRKADCRAGETAR